jgi:uncharacterized MAPEG superfamily protein
MSLADPQFRIFAICCCVLALNLLFIAFGTAITRTRTKKIVNPEDVSVVGGSTVVELESTEVARYHRAHRNALENIVPFFIVGLLYVNSGASLRGATIYFVTFTVARVLHSIVYIAGKQPWRTALFAIGALATIGMLTHVLLAALRA